jgi:hypothetical protein
MIHSYPLDLTAALALKKQEYTCSTNFADDQLVPVPAGYNTCPIPSYIPAGYKCSTQCGRDLLESYGVQYSTEWIIYNFLCLLAFAVGLFIIGYVGTKYVRHISR